MQVKSHFKLDPMDLATRLRQVASLMNDMGSPVQISLFEPKFGSIELQAAAEGRQAAEAGRSMDMDRWPENTPGAADYSRAWNDLMKERAMKIGAPEGATH